jgi:hypothetical protein
VVPGEKDRNGKSPWNRHLKCAESGCHGDVRRAVFSIIQNCRRYLAYIHWHSLCRNPSADYATAHEPKGFWSGPKTQHWDVLETGGGAAAVAFVKHYVSGA